ncbi:MAG: hypothetical protein FWF35_03820 [Elusimicrobia bacterium]|nr:hypothetical protein [Elusimicrobiota bacterium]
MINLKAISDAANRAYLLNGAYIGSTGAALTFADLDIDPPTGSNNFGFSFGTCNAAGCVINACRKASSSTTDAAACTGPKYTITYTLASGGTPVRTCVAGTDTTSCNAITAMLK